MKTPSLSCPSLPHFKEKALDFPFLFFFYFPIFYFQSGRPLVTPPFSQFSWSKLKNIFIPAFSPHIYSVSKCCPFGHQNESGIWPLLVFKQPSQPLSLYGHPAGLPNRFPFPILLWTLLPTLKLEFCFFCFVLLLFLIKAIPLKKSHSQKMIDGLRQNSSPFQQPERNDKESGHLLYGNGSSHIYQLQIKTKQVLYMFVLKYSLISFSSIEYITIIFKVLLLHWNLWKTTKWITIANVHRAIYTRQCTKSWRGIILFKSLVTVRWGLRIPTLEMRNWE